jgi:N-acetylglucosaminyl-diphospho-decaprenol L-rhamnosyltransferase
MNLLVIIVNYRTPDLTLNCLASLAPQIGDVPESEVIVVDNASGDESVPYLTAAIKKNHWENWATLLASKQNLGFAGGNNRAMDKLLDHPEARYVLMLNSDTIVRPGVLKHCYEKMNDDIRIGIMSCMLLNSDETVQNTARRLPTPWRMAAISFGLPWVWPKAFAWAELDDLGWDRRKESREVEWVGGAFMFVRRKVIDKLGGLDTRFFFYGEDVEFCRRARRHEWIVWYDPAVAVVHLAGQSSDSTRLAPKDRDAMKWQARYLIQRSCYGIAAEIFLRTADIASSGLRFLKLLFLRRSDSPEYAAQKGILTMLLHWPSTSDREALPAGRR